MFGIKKLKKDIELIKKQNEKFNKFFQSKCEHNFILSDHCCVIFANALLYCVTCSICGKSMDLSYEQLKKMREEKALKELIAFVEGAK